LIFFLHLSGERFRLTVCSLVKQYYLRKIIRKEARKKKTSLLRVREIFLPFQDFDNQGSFFFSLRYLASLSRLGQPLQQH